MAFCFPKLVRQSYLLLVKRTAASAACVLAFAAVGTADDPCPTFTITGTVTTGDGSTMPGGFSLYTTPINGQGQAGFMGSYPAGATYSKTFQPHNEDYDVQWFAVSGEYFWSPIGGSLSCHPNPATPGCGTCTGGFALTLYATEGAIEGTVEVSPKPPVGIAGIPVGISRTLEGGGGGYALTDADGHFEFRAQTEPARSNKWGVGVDPHYSPWPHSSTGDATYYLSAGLAVSDPVTVTSSQLKSATLKIPAPRAGGAGDTTKRGNSCDDNVGKPVNVQTGNVFFDQTDVSIPALQTLVFTRSYNSIDAALNVASNMSRGWSHSYGRSLSFPDAVSIDFRGDDGVFVYYQDIDGDAVYDAVLPATERSRILKNGGTYTRRFLGGAHETYDASGRLTSIVDEAGNVTTLARDINNRLVSVGDAGGRSLALGYDGQGRLATLSAGSQAIASYLYDAAGLVHSVRYPDGGGYVFVSDEQGKVLRVEDMTGRTIESHTYGSSGIGLTSEIADGHEKYTLSYEPLRTAVLDALGNTTSYEWQWIDAVKRITKRVGHCPSCGAGSQETTQWSYDEKGRVLTIQNDGEASTTYTYDAEGNRTSMTDPLARTTTYTYDSEGRVLTVASPGGGLVTYTYGSHGPLTETEKVSATVSRTTTYAYTVRGQVETVTDPRGETTTYAYNSYGDLESVTDPLNHTTTFQYDAFGRPTTVTDALNHSTTTDYDVRGRVQRVTTAAGTHTDFGYDLAGRRGSLTDPLANTTRWVYNRYGQLERVVDSLDGVTLYEYDLMGALVGLTDAKGNRTAFEYDNHRRVTKLTYPGGVHEDFVYDERGRVESKTDRKGVVTTYAYDGLGRLLTKGYSDGMTPQVSYTYDAAGRLSTAANGTDTLTWTYDLAGQLLSEQSNRNGSVVSYSYDPAGNRLSLSLDGQLFVTYGYDSASRLTAITRGTNATSLTYDNANRRTSMSYPNGITTSYSYDNLDRLTRLKADLSATPITDFQYVYDAAGDRTRKQQLDYTEDYTYDPLYRLTGVERSVGLTGIWQYGYDPVGNRTTNQINDSVMTAAFSDRNQLTSGSGGGALKVRGTLNEPGTAKVNGNSARMLAGNIFEATIQAAIGTNTFAIEATDQSGNLTTKNYQISVAATGATYTYDSNGNRTTKTEGSDTWDYEWNANNELTRVTKNSAEQARFGYDPMGRRVEKVAGGVTTSYEYDRENLLREVRGGTTLKYVNGQETDEPLAMDNGTALSYFHNDALGSIVKTTDTAGAVTLTRQYDAWGTLEVGASEPGYAFTGREWDPEIGLYYYRARYYDAKVASFLSQDPIGLRGGDVNFYAYVRNHPVNLIDPSGMRYIPNVVINCDSKPYVATGDTGPNSPGQMFLILPGMSPTGGPGVTPPWWDIDFICTPCGWRKIKVGGVIIGGLVLGSIAPPPDWTPPFECNKEDRCKKKGK